MRSDGEIEPMALSERDVEMGGRLHTPDDPFTPQSTKGVPAPRTAGGIRDKIAQGQIKARMTALWRNGESYLDICDTVNAEFGLHETGHAITPRTLTYHMTQMIEYWRNQSLLHIDERQAAVLFRYDQIEQLATQAWFDSTQGRDVRNYQKQIERATGAARKEDIKEMIRKEREAQKKPALFTEGELLETLQLTSEKIKEYSRHESSAGDPRFLAIMIDINHKRSQLWGLLAKGEQSTSDQEFAKLSDESRTERIAAVIAQARQRASGGTGHLAPSAPLGGFKEGEEPPIETRADPPAPILHKPMTLPDTIPDDPILIEEVWDDDDWQ